jgi:hypothetical protein
MPKRDSDASALASLLDGSKAGELIPELARHGLQQLIELEALGGMRSQMRRGGCKHALKPPNSKTGLTTDHLLNQSLRFSIYAVTPVYTQRVHLRQQDCGRRG